MQIEVWKDIKDYQGLYQVSNFGRVKSLSYHRENKEKIMIGSKTGKGYKTVHLSKNGKIKSFLIHRLVYETFVGVIPNGMQVDHVNNNPSDNRLQNLQILTPSENTKKMYRDNNYNVSCGKTKIKCIETNQIFNSQKEASRKMNLWHQAINNVLKGKIKKTGGYTFEYIDEK